MITIDINPVLISFGHMAIHWYGVIVALAILVAIWLVSMEARRKGFSESHLDNMTTWVIIAGFMGARLLHVVDHWSFYSREPIRALYIWEGGLAIWGAVLGGLLAMALFAWRHSLRLGFLADMVAPGLVLGQAIGRAACIITGDAVGAPTSGPLGLAYVRPEAMVPELGVYYAPLPLYEGIGNLAILALLWRLRRKHLPDGLLFLMYLGLYGLQRFIVGFSSSYQIVTWGMTQSQIIALLGLAVAIPLALSKWRSYMKLASVRVLSRE